MQIHVAVSFLFVQFDSEFAVIIDTYCGVQEVDFIYIYIYIYIYTLVKPR